MDSSDGSVQFWPQTCRRGKASKFQILLFLLKNIMYNLFSVVASSCTQYPRFGCSQHSGSNGWRWSWNSIENSSDRYHKTLVMNFRCCHKSRSWEHRPPHPERPTASWTSRGVAQTQRTAGTGWVSEDWNQTKTSPGHWRKIWVPHRVKK